MTYSYARKHQLVIDFLRKVPQATTMEIYNAVPFGYYANEKKHMGNLLATMVRRRMIERVNPGVFRLHTSLKINNMKCDTIKIPIRQLIEEPMTCNGKKRFSHPGWTCKIPKGITPCDFDKSEKLIEVELTNGERYWPHIKEFFGKVVGEAKEILLLYPDGETESMSIVNVGFIKLKRTNYWKLIFERDLPF